MLIVRAVPRHASHVLAIDDSRPASVRREEALQQREVVLPQPSCPATQTARPRFMRDRRVPTRLIARSACDGLRWRTIALRSHQRPSDGVHSRGALTDLLRRLPAVIV